MDSNSKSHTTYVLGPHCPAAPERPTPIDTGKTHVDVLAGILHATSPSALDGLKGQTED